MFTSAIIPAAGAGERMGSTVSKQFLTLHGKPIVIHTLEKFQLCDAVDEIVVAVQPSSRHQIEFLISEFHISKVTAIAEGGRRRQDSVANALSRVRPNADIVVVHDAVRPFVQQKLIKDAIEKARTHSAAVVAVRMKDTVKVGSQEGLFERTLDRSVLWSAQTPQAFAKQLLVDAYAKANREDIDATDDASLVEMLNVQPAIVVGSFDNIKITTPDDLDFANVLAHRFKD
ncbi:MAG TPA: 2-C-methyl-D-erythritol 4-phosphate cytidylyltransferase [Bacteroidota bacterium]|nr:2-C-methyl-D-erythritol 4-phosphate cytidylyltransferase [Bacteroidota bacterium]